jgi:hypothetical protein
LNVKLISLTIGAKSIIIVAKVLYDAYFDKKIWLKSAFFFQDNYTTGVDIFENIILMYFCLSPYDVPNSPQKCPDFSNKKMTAKVVIIFFYVQI